MRKTYRAVLTIAPLLTLAPFAISANCVLYEASVPTTISQSKEVISQTAPAHVLVVRDTGFRTHPVDFLIVPLAIVRQRFSLDQSTAGATTSPSTTAARGQTAVARTTITPMPPGVNDHFPEPGHLVLMSNSAFYGDVVTNTDPATVTDTTAAAEDLGKFSQVQNTGFHFALDPSALNGAYAWTQPGATGVPQLLSLTQGSVSMVFLAESQEILAGMTMVIEDRTTAPPTQLQYNGVLEAKYMKTVSC